MWFFWVSAAVMLVLMFVLVAHPWLVKNRRQSEDVLSNAQITRQRLAELEREESEGLINHEDKAQAIKELKLALVEEQQDSVNSQASPRLAILVGGALALAVGVWVYWSSNQLAGLTALQSAEARLSELSDRIVMNPDPNIKPQDVADFTLALRKRLHDDARLGKQDATGWMLLGRLHMSINQLEQSIQAFDRALQLQPDSTGVMGSLGQALLMTGDRDAQRRATRVLSRLLQIEPNNDNAKLLLVVSSAEIGDLDTARQYFVDLKDKLPKSDPMMVSLRNRLYPDEVMSDANNTGSTGFIVTVDIDSALRDKLPAQATLFVFAQDALSGARMPAAVVKTTLDKLPVEVALTDENAMMPTYKLSQLQRTKLIARVSLDQNVETASGELQGQTLANVEPGKTSSQTIIINEELL